MAFMCHGKERLRFCLVLFQYNTELGGKKVQTKIPLQSSKTEFKIYTNLGLMLSCFEQP